MKRINGTENGIPQAIVFDNGRTVTYEPDHSTDSGAERLLRTVCNEKSAPVTAAEYLEKRKMVLSELHAVSDAGFEIPEIKVMRILFAHYNIQTKLSDCELETIYWNGISFGKPTDGIEDLFCFLMSRHIKIGILSNGVYGTEVLKARLKRIFPDVTFDAVISSSDYLIRKPNPLLFIAIADMLNVAPENTWFCGDSVNADINGAVKCGMAGIWYTNKAKDIEEQNTQLPVGALRVSDWDELLCLLKRIL